MGTVRVAVIGAGAAGLAQLAQLQAAFARPGAANLEVVCFELRSEIGGTWNLDPQSPTFLQSTVVQDGEERTFLYPPEGQYPSPMYDGLRTNLPHDLMSFRQHPFPDGTALFPDSPTVLEYLRSYARTLGLLPHIRFSTRVERVYHRKGSARRWTVESAGPDGHRVEEFDFVSVANGHYSDAWVPPIPGVSTFPANIIHSRQYRRPTDFAGQTVLVVGSFASGSDVARQIASLNLEPDAPRTQVYQSSSAPPSETKGGSLSAPWRSHVTPVPLIERFEGPSEQHRKGRVVFKSDPTIHEPLDNVDVVIFATGYNFSYPFFKAEDQPWRETRLVDDVIREEERVDGNKWEVGGLKGLGMRKLDELLLFLQGDRSMAFLALPYQIVPFPLAEVQGRLASLLWAGLLPDFPSHPQLPPNPNNPCDRPQDSSAPPVRTVFQQRQQLVFVAPYEWTYEEFLMTLMAQADRDAPACWKKVEDWRRARRADNTLRLRTLGY